jgi:EAL domain-containing protein (putative c-di-GMP-specific phosphodiesterase class I)
MKAGATGQLATDDRAASRAPAAAWTKGEHQQLDYVLRRELVRAVYQPIIDLATGKVAAYEALARGPKGTPMESPGALFGAARRSGRLRELEWACRKAALAGAVDAGLGTQVSLFVNVEPGVVGGGTPPALEQTLRVSERKLRVVLELTERDLCHRPVDLLRLVAWARQRWWGVALDDVGADETSLALLPLVEPDVVKLDMALVQNALTAEGEAIVRAVRDYAERTGATVLAEGIENDEHLAHAHELGATLGQGWALGMPGDLDRPKQVSAVRLLTPPPPPRSKTPWEVLAVTEPVEKTTVARMNELLADLATEAAGLARPSLVLGAVGDPAHDPSGLDRCASLAPTATAVIALGLGAEQTPRPGVRTVDLDPASPVRNEQLMIVVTPDYVGAVVARGPGCDPSRGGDEVELVVSRDRASVITAARLLFAAAIDRTA